MRLCRQINRKRYLPIYWDAEDYFNTELPLDEGAFLVGMAAGLVESLPEGEVPKERLWNRGSSSSSGSMSLWTLPSSPLLVR